MRRRNPLLLLLATLTACEATPPLQVGVVVSRVPAQAATVALGPDSVLNLIVRPNPEPVDAEVAIRQAAALVAEPGLIAVVGHSNSAASLAASQVYNEAGVVQIAPTSTAPLYDEAGPYSFRMVPSDSAQGRRIAAAATELRPDARRVSVIYVNDDYGRGLFRAARPSLRNVTWEGIYADVADSVAVLELTGSIIASEPDVLVWLGRPRRLRQVLPGLRAALPNVTVLCSDACDEPTVYGADREDYRGLFFMRFVDPGAPPAASFAQRYRELTGDAATGEAMLTYDATLLVKAAVQAGATTGEDLRQYLNSLGRERPPFRGITGSIQFDAAGSVTRSYDLAWVRAPGDVVSQRGAAR